MTNKEIMDIAMQQSAYDTNAKVSDFRIQMYLLNLELDLWQENIIKNLSLVILCLMEAM